VPRRSPTCWACCSAPASASGRQCSPVELPCRRVHPTAPR
jgi:hypothetical protein